MARIFFHCLPECRVPLWAWFSLAFFSQHSFNVQNIFLCAFGRSSSVLRRFQPSMALKNSSSNSDFNFNSNLKSTPALFLKSKDSFLWNIWNLVEAKDESELVESMDTFDKMVHVFEKKSSENQQKESSQSSESSESPKVSTNNVNTNKSNAYSNANAHMNAHMNAHNNSNVYEMHDKLRTLSISSDSSWSDKSENEEDEYIDNLLETLSKVPNEITLTYITQSIELFKVGEYLPITAIMEIVKRVKDIVMKEANIVHRNVHTKITVVGDLHGQLEDLLMIFQLNGYPSVRSPYIFNGDFVDRGDNSVEVISLLFLFKLLAPKAVTLNRGNHEVADLNNRDGFMRECVKKYGHAVYNLFEDCFSALPLGSIIDKRTLVIHGGLFWENPSIDDLQKIDRFVQRLSRGSQMEQLLWSDPMKAPGREKSPRGAGLLFGPDVTQAFLAKNNLRLIIRSHECVAEGYELTHNNCLVTLFSCSNYNHGRCPNAGAYAVIDKDPSVPPTFVSYHANDPAGQNYFERHQPLRDAIAEKIIDRIARARLQLIDWLSAKAREVAGKRTHIISRELLSTGLKTVLKLDIPYLEFSEELGLPAVGPGGELTNVDFMEFLARFKPSNPLILQNNDDESVATHDTDLAMEHLIEMLYKNSIHLDALFRHFDIDGDDQINLNEFKEGILALQDLLDLDRMSDAAIETLLHRLDVDQNGQISYAEFFQCFTVAHESFKATRALMSPATSTRGMKLMAMRTPAFNARKLGEISR